MVPENPRSADLVLDDFENRVIDLQMISPDNPSEPVATVSELAVDNFDWSSRELGSISISLSMPETTTLPLGVFSAELTDNAFEGAHYPYVVFNNSEGHLYRVDVSDTEGSAVRFS